MPTPQRNTPILDVVHVPRFLVKMQHNPSTGCTNWTSAKNCNGYGTFGVRQDGKQRNYLAHRLAWALAHNQEAPKEFEVCHTCDNRKCVNPAHLYLGTRQQNVRDAVERGRYYKPRCQVCFCIPRETWVDGNRVMCGRCYREHILNNPRPRIVKFTQLPLPLERAA